MSTRIWQWSHQVQIFTPKQGLYRLNFLFSKGEMTQGFGEFIILAEFLGSVSSSIQHLTIICDFSGRGLDAFFWPPQALGAWMHAKHACTLNQINKSKNKFETPQVLYFCIIYYELMVQIPEFLHFFWVTQCLHAACHINLLWSLNFSGSHIMDLPSFQISLSLFSYLVCLKLYWFDLLMSSAFRVTDIFSYFFYSLFQLISLIIFLLSVNSGLVWFFLILDYFFTLLWCVCLCVCL